LIAALAAALCSCAPARGAQKGGIEWVSIPGGAFTMGADDLTAAHPRHLVHVVKFKLARTLVTRDEYKQCVDAGICTAPHCGWPAAAGEKDLPVACVDWGQAKAFSEWVGGRLPTEAEWEYAARGAGRDQKYPWGDEEPTCERAVFGDHQGTGCGRGATWPVCSKPGGNTTQGLCDMAGSLWEWTQDWYHESYDHAPSDGSAWELPAGAYRVFRGGMWDGNTWTLRAAYRQYAAAGEANDGLGFRPARRP
jgi:formylglycine-generating enzyme required for sulfatase activity